MSGVIVEVSARVFAIPLECPCCGAAPDSELTIAPRPGASQAGEQPARGLEFPYCQSCKAHVTAWASASSTASGVAFLGILAGVVTGAFTRVAIGAVVAGGSIPFAMAIAARRRARARSACGPACASPDTAVTYLGTSGGVRAFSFESPTYTARFAEQNTAVLTNVGPELRRLIEGHRVARLVVPTPAAPVTVVAAPLTVDEWIGRLDAAPGRIARRSTLARALEATPEPDERARLLTAASRLEVAPVVDQLDERSSVAARRRLLEAAIADARADNLIDELRDHVVRELEARLRAIPGAGPPR
ncbi:MAG TPA: hypothetical protein VFK02_28225 [Kofleriaceae bacterium]|nr:hypothetical protein [Kofleriaceae bacterium]